MSNYGSVRPLTRAQLRRCKLTLRRLLRTMRALFWFRESRAHQMTTEHTASSVVAQPDFVRVVGAMPCLDWETVSSSVYAVLFLAVWPSASTTFIRRHPVG